MTSLVAIIGTIGRDGTIRSIRTAGIIVTAANPLDARKIGMTRISGTLVVRRVVPNMPDTRGIGV